VCTADADHQTERIAARMSRHVANLIRGEHRGRHTLACDPSRKG
jgi:hypothetical protein